MSDGLGSANFKSPPGVQNPRFGAKAIRRTATPATMPQTTQTRHTGTAFAATDPSANRLRDIAASTPTPNQAITTAVPP